jgi:hypothetical protein
MIEVDDLTKTSAMVTLSGRPNLAGRYLLSRVAPIPRVSSKQTKYIFGLKRKEPKHNLFRLFFGLFRETKKLFFGLFQCFEHVWKQPKQTNLFRKKPKQTKKICKLCSSKYSIHCTLVGKHVQVQCRTLVDCRQAQVQNKALVDRNAQMQHRLLKTDTSRCSTKLL